MQQNLPDRDRAAEQRAEDRQRVVARMRRKTQIEREPEARQHETDALQDAERARQILVEQLIAERETEHRGDREQPERIEAEREALGHDAA